MRRDSDFFGDQELALIYIARRLKEALAIESLLTNRGFDYLVEADRYRGGFIFQTERVGAFFYVTPALEMDARALLAQHGYRAFEPLQ